MTRITREPIDAAALIAAANLADCGGIAAFLGTVRRQTGAAVTEALEYDAYTPMAERVLSQIEEAARAEWPVQEFQLVHRLGRLVVGEVSVVAVVSCPHRADAFAACRYAIDRLKAEAPIWKREHGPGHAPEWVHP